MKKIIPLLFLAFLTSHLHAQFKIGLRFGGAVSSARVDSDPEVADIAKDENTIRPLFGLTVDLPIKDNVGFSSGLGYAPKKASIVIRDDTGTVQGTENYRLQYLQIPLLVRFTTNEIMPGFKVYFTTGFGWEIKVFEEANNRDPLVVDKFKPIDASFNLGTGIEYSIGPDTILYGGLTYNRGLINSVKDVVGTDPDLKINNDLIGIEVGVRF